MRRECLVDVAFLLNSAQHFSLNRTTDWHSHSVFFNDEWHNFFFGSNIFLVTQFHFRSTTFLLLFSFTSQLLAFYNFSAPRENFHRSLAIKLTISIGKHPGALASNFSFYWLDFLFRFPVFGEFSLFTNSNFFNSLWINFFFFCADHTNLVHRY